jgi:hypothetical protein
LEEGEISVCCGASADIQVPSSIVSSSVILPIARFEMSSIWGATFFSFSLFFWAHPLFCLGRPFGFST